MSNQTNRPRFAPLGSGMVDKRHFPFSFSFGTGTTAGASNSSVTGMSVVKAPFFKAKARSVELNNGQIGSLQATNLW